MNKLLKSWLLNTLLLYAVSQFMQGMAFRDLGAVLATGLALTLLNATVKPLLKVLTLPLSVLTLGLFSLVINAVILELAFKLTTGGMIASLGTALVASLLLAVLLAVLNSLFGIK